MLEGVTSSARLSLSFRSAEQGDDIFVDRLAEEAGLSVDAEAERARGHARLWIAFSLEELGAEERLGFVLLWLAADEAEVVDVAVRSDKRGEGVGRRLLKFSLLKVREEGAKEAFLEVRRANSSAQALYNRLGFSQLGERKGYYGGFEDALLFRCCLDSLE